MSILRSHEIHDIVDINLVNRIHVHTPTRVTQFTSLI